MVIVLCRQKNNNARRPTTTEDQRLNYEPRWIHGGDYVPLAAYKDSLLLLFYRPPSPITLIHNSVRSPLPHFA